MLYSSCPAMARSAGQSIIMYFNKWEDCRGNWRCMGNSFAPYTVSFPLITSYSWSCPGQTDSRVSTLVSGERARGQGQTCTGGNGAGQWHQTASLRAEEAEIPFRGRKRVNDGLAEGKEHSSPDNYPVLGVVRRSQDLGGIFHHSIGIHVIIIITYINKW